MKDSGRVFHFTNLADGESCHQPSLMMSFDSDIDYLLALYDEQYPDEVDQFEDLLSGMLGINWHPETSLDDWRVQRVRAINGAGEEADRLAVEVERLLLPH